MRPPGSIREWSFVACLLAFGCTPSIGDACKLHTDCSATGDRICEPNLPGGYCTIFNCEPDKCPDDAACVAFGAALSTKPECASQQSQRLERTFCMKTCSSPGDCRGGYACVSLEHPADQTTNPWGATVLDPDRGTSICMAPLSSKAISETKIAREAGSPQVCEPQPPLPPPPDAAPPAKDGSSSIRDAAPVTDAARRDGGARPPEAGLATPDAGLGAPDARGVP
jgi:hypothetical protein